MHLAMEHNPDIADRAFEPLVEAAKGNARALLALAEKAQQRSDPARAHDLAAQAMALEPDNAEIQAIGRALVARLVPGWHARMVKDEPRNAAFQRAIERAVEPGKRVLDIGSGSGLLAMMAARAGADEVHSCELNPAVAAIATEIVATNGYAGQITVHTKNSRLLDTQADLGGKADIIVSEIIANDLVSEHVLPTMLDAARRLAAPGAQFIPRSGDICVALAYWGNLEHRYLGQECGFDLQLFNRLRPRRFAVQVTDPTVDLRGVATDMFSFDFSSTEEWTQRAAADLVSTGGPVNGVLVWFRLQMDDVDSFEMPFGPDASSSWAYEFFPFETAVELAAGDVVSMAATVAGNRLQMWQAA
jgi:type III protein arginine methyltransferase